MTDGLIRASSERSQRPGKSLFYERKELKAGSCVSQYYQCHGDGEVLQAAGCGRKADRGSSLYYGGCGMAWCAEPEEEAAVKEVLNGQSIETEGIYRILL